MAEVVLERLTKAYAEKDGRMVRAVDAIDLTIADREFLVLVGPSGCGKSTTLRLIAGLEEVTDGSVRIDGRVVNQVHPKDRDIAMVFQNYALYPHLTVFDNLAFSLKLRGFPREEIRRRVGEAAGMLGLEPYLERKPKALSGGQRQRVALGRAIVRHPKVFLFDEPLSNLDAKMRVAMRMEIAKLRTQLQATMIYVTHDQMEAMTLGDRICVMQGGKIQQVDRPMEVYRKPINRFVAGFIGSPPMNFLPWKRAGREVVLGLRPEHLSLAPPDSPAAEGIFRGVVEIVEPMGAETFVHARVGDRTLIARLDPALAAPYTVGAPIFLRADLREARSFDSATGELAGSDAQ